MSAPVDLGTREKTRLSALRRPVAQQRTADVLSRVPVEVARVAEEAQHETTRLLLLHGEDVRVLACARADEVVRRSHPTLGGIGHQG